MDNQEEEKEGSSIEEEVDDEDLERAVWRRTLFPRGDANNEETKDGLEETKDGMGDAKNDMDVELATAQPEPTAAASVVPTEEWGRWERKRKTTEIGEAKTNDQEEDKGQPIPATRSLGWGP